MDYKSSVDAEAIITPELYFLISKFLLTGPLQDTAKVLIRELEEKKVLPKRTDWLGNKHDLSFAELEQKYQHVEANHLLKICLRIGPILDKELKPSVSGLVSLLGSGRQSLLRRKDTIYKSRSLLDYCSRLHGASIPDSSLTKPVHNLQRVIIGREYGGPVRHKLLVPTTLYGKTKLLRRTVGHLSSVYCVLFDRTGRYIITGADDLLVKIWSAMDGRLLATLRGASAEITDIAINLDNTMLAAGSIDRVLRVWDLQTTCPIAVLTGHTGMITSVNFCPSPRSDMKYLVTTSTDGSIAFWQYTMPRGQKITFMPKPIQYHEKLRPGQAQMMCTSFSPGGMFLAAGSADHHVRVYLMSEDGPKRILETEVYADAVDSVQWAHKGLRFISGSKDGTAHIWSFESQQWKSIKLTMTDRLQSCPEPEEGKKFKVTMVAWDYSDKYVITAVNDFTIKIWHSKTGKLHCVLRGHKDELYVLESNPTDEHILLSAGHDGQVFLWDIEKGVSVAHFINDIDGQGHGGVFDAKWSPDGTMIAATDSHGHLIIYGLGMSPDKYKMLPSELFFHTDYRPLLRDASHHVVDEQTQVMPHLMPPPFLVDADGNPHPAKYQRYVPGRENCSSDQLLPNFEGPADPHSFYDMQPNGNVSELDRLIEALANRQGAAPASHNQSQLDRMIEALANRQGQGAVSDSHSRTNNNSISPRISLHSQLGHQTNGNEREPEANNANRALSVWGRPPEPPQVQQVNVAANSNSLKFVRVIYVRPMKYSQLHNLRQTVFASGQYEMHEYKREMRRRPIMINTASSLPSVQNNANRLRGARTNGNTYRSARRRAQTQQPAYRTRAVRDQEDDNLPRQRIDVDEEEEAEVSSVSSEDTSYSHEEEENTSEDSDTESSDYSDWVADTPGPNLEPPKRSKRKPLSRKGVNMDDSSEEETPPDQASTSANVTKKSKKSIAHQQLPNGEIPEIYRPAEWLSEVIPRKAPYYPQMGDEVVYFRQGHQRYLDAVRTKKVYKLSHSSEPWNFRNLRDHEFVRVIGIKYEIRPPRLCCLKLAMIDEESNMTGTTFKIKYHDMPDVLDFLVLRQTYDLAVQRNWSIGDRFRCMIGDGWWMGQIESRHPLSSEFPDSYFMCFHVRWDNGEYEYMSPWDMEPIDENRLPDEVGGAVPVLPEEIRATLYQPKSEEWHRGDRDGSCRRIISGLEQVMRLSIAEHFLAPVDLNIYPDYAYMIEYPIDLTTIKSRFENHFYRRITSAQFDVRYLATNAEKYNRSHTKIVKHARIITDLCLRVIREPDEIDVAGVYHQMVDVYHSSESENDNDSDAVPSTSTGPSTSVIPRQKAAATRRSNRIRSDGDWRLDCRQLLDLLWRHPDSVPFREPVDTMQFPDYLEIIPSPMDLRTVKEDLLGGNYQCPSDFAKDVRLIFQNSRNYNTNTRSRIYAMTLRLSSLFEQQFKNVVTNWKAARRKSNKNRGKSRRSSSSPAKRTPPERNRQSSRRAKKSSRTQPYSIETDNMEPSGSSRLGTRLRNMPRNANGISNSSNRVTSSSYRSTLLNGDQGPRSSRRNRRNGFDLEHEENDEEISVAHSTSSSGEEVEDAEENEDHVDYSSDGSGSLSCSVESDAPKRRGRPPKQKKNSNGSDSEDSEESYKPEKARRARKPKNSARQSKKTKRRKKNVSIDSMDNNQKKQKKTNSSATANKNDPVSQTSKKRRQFIVYSDETQSPIPCPNGYLNDESTQDAPTPKKKGRPPKPKPVGISNGTVINNSKTRMGNTNSTVNDHSYHLPAVQTTEINGRPSRQTVKRNFANFDYESDTHNGSENAEEILPTPSYRNNKVSKVSNDMDDKPSTSRAALAALRNDRTHSIPPVVNTDDENLSSSDDDAPLVRKQKHSNNTKNSSVSPTKVNSNIVTRSNATSSNSPSIVVATSSSSLVSVSGSMPIHDHNYLGSIAATTTSRQTVIRNTRQGLSRHQRNASELDSNVDNIESSTQLTSTTSLIAASSSSSRQLPRRGRSRQDQEQDNSDVRTAEDSDGSQQEPDSTEEKIDSDSEEDDQPLTNFVKKIVPNSYAKANKSLHKRRTGRRPNNYDDDYENNYANYSNKLRKCNKAVGGGGDRLSSGRNHRRAKTEKRPRYNEQSDDDDDDDGADDDYNIPQSKKRAISDSSPRKHYKRQQANDDITSSEDERLLSVSSRGRVRKIIPQARRIFKD